MTLPKLHLPRKKLPTTESSETFNMTHWLHQLPRYWRQSNAVTLALWPLEILYRITLLLRQFLFELGFLKQHRVNATVVVVGNVVAGGGGKTPLTMALVNRLVLQGFEVGVISRGYGRHTVGLQIVTEHSRVGDVGDEPLLIFQKCHVPVVVGANRVDAANHLLKNFPDIKILVCDDGLQHRALQRDIEICVMDAVGIGNGHLLPAGPLREPWPRNTDLLLHTDTRSMAEGFESTRQLALEAMSSQGKNVPISDLLNQPVEVVSGIAKPQNFLAMLREQQFKIQAVTALPDHDNFENFRPQHPECILLCTEKDAAKLWTRFPLALAIPLIFEPENAFWLEFDLLFKARHRYH